MAREIIQAVKAKDMFPVSRIEVTAHALARFQEGLEVGLIDAASLIRDKLSQATFSGQGRVRRGTRHEQTFHFEDSESKLIFVVERTRRGAPQLRTVKIPSDNLVTQPQV